MWLENEQQNVPFFMQESFVLKTYQGNTKSAMVKPFQTECMKNQYFPPP